jgi:hypothetical protein
MNVKDFLKKYQLVLVLSFIVISLFIIKQVYGYKGNEVVEEIKISPTPTMVIITPTISEKEATETARIRSLIPYSNKDFTVVDYEASSSTFKIKTDLKSKENVIQKIIVWLQKNNLDPVKYQVVFEN